MVVDTTPVRIQDNPEEHGSASFGRVAGAWFMGLAGLYLLYLWAAFPGPESGLSVQDRLLMALGPTMVAFSFLISPAVFAAALERFRPFSGKASARNAANWGCQAVFALAACSLSALAPHLAVSLMPIALHPTSEDALVAYQALAMTRLLLPMAMGLLALCAGVAGALIGQATANWRRRHRDASRWLACLALIASFLLPLLATTSLIQQSHAPAYWIIVGPLTIPLILVGALAWRLRNTLNLRISRRQRPTTLDPETFDRIVAAVSQGEDHRKRPLKDLTSTGLELEMARIVAGILKEIGVRAAIPEARVQEIVTAMLETRTPRIVSPAKLVLESGKAGVFVTSWACFATGLLIVSPLGGVPMSLLSAAGVGLLGSCGVTLVAQRYPSLSDTVPA